MSIGISGRFFRFDTVALLVLLLSTIQDLKAQQDSGTLFRTYLEIYQHAKWPRINNNNVLPELFYSHNRLKEPALNIGFLHWQQNQKRFRSSVALAAGTYMMSNYEGESAFFPYVMEAFVGWRLPTKQKLWLDIGILPSHIGFESPIGGECYTLSRSIAADNSPYYVSGAKLTYQFNNQAWSLAFLGMNGWQNIQRANYPNSIAIGHQLQYQTEKAKVMSSSFIGQVPVFGQMIRRYFHHFSASYHTNNRYLWLLSADIGHQEGNISNLQKPSTWATAQMLFRRQISAKWHGTFRVEHYYDPYNVLQMTWHGTNVFSYSLNLDFAKTETLLFRLEHRSLRFFHFSPGNPMRKLNLLSFVVAVDIR